MRIQYGTVFIQDNSSANWLISKLRVSPTDLTRIGLKIQVKLCTKELYFSNTFVRNEMNLLDTNIIYNLLAIIKQRYKRKIFFCIHLTYKYV